MPTSVLPAVVSQLSPSVRGLEISPTVGINELCDQLKAQGRSIVKLGLGQSPFPVPVPVVEELRANAARKEYLPVRGLPALREAVAAYHRRSTDLPYTADDVLVGPGSKELMFLLQVAYDGEFFVPTPAWVSYAPQARIVGRQVHYVHCGPESGWKMSGELLDRACAESPPGARVLILNYPGNPTGTSYAPRDLEAIARVAERRGVVILSDEIYGELHHEGRHRSIAPYYPGGTIISSGLSKWCGAGGWRLGTFTFPSALRWLLKGMAAVASETYTSTSAPIQYAAVRAFEGGITIERYLHNARRVLKALGGRITARLRQAGASVQTPEGAFYLFVDFSPLRERLAARGIHDGTELCRRLLEEEGVAMLPGDAFGRPPGDLATRVAYVDFDGARTLAAAEAVAPDAVIDDAFLEQHCRFLLDGIERACRWLERER